MKVSVTYAEARHQAVLDAEVEEGATVEQAIIKSGILKKFGGLDLGSLKTGIYGKLVPLTQVLAAGDRVELYRPALGKPPKKGAAAAKEEAGSEEEAA
ncbi:RnfH family protein [Candidatus Magnetaquicoccus inordinatus]|uniref:RnfH family protein n=1 Tax=Candidatus Magnetaquicoccus inordinatus TaxID=2496818 RepID=UPI00102C778A|nr:RnfH family protein [Candidatus Magnetaquicoccus inordinatus]